MRDAKPVRNVVSETVVAGHGRCRGPSEIVVKHLSEPPVFSQTNIGQGLVEADDCAAVHLMVLAIAAVHPHDRGLVAKGVAVCGRPAECLAPIGGQSLAVLGVKTVTCATTSTW